MNNTEEDSVQDDIDSDDDNELVDVADCDNI